MIVKNELRQLLFTSVALFVLLMLPAVMIGQNASQKTAGGSSNNDTATSKKEPSSKFEDNIRYLVEIGGQYKHVTGDRPTKLEEYGQIRKGPLFRRFRISSSPPESPEFLRFMGRNVSENDQQYLIDFGKYRSFRVKVEFSGNSHFYSAGSRSFFTRGYDTLEVDDSVQSVLEMTPDASIPATVQSLLASAPSLKLKTKRNTLDASLSYYVTDNWTIRLSWNRQERNGTRPLGSGSYERIGTTMGDTFRVHSIELPAPTDTTTDRIVFGTSYLRKNWGLNFAYVFSNFENYAPNLFYENPFRITDLQATGSGGVFDRMKMARGALALEPSNQSQTIAVSAFVDLPRTTRLAGAWSWSFWKQNEAFLPFTQNTAIVTGVPAGLNITSTSSLPEQRLDGKVDIFSQDYLLASKPWKNWTFNVHYRRYDNENKSKSILFPGYVAFVESWWRTRVSGLNNQSVPVENEVKSYTKTNVTGEGIWDISRLFRLKLGYEWEGWLREHRQVANSGEHILYSQFTFDPKGRFTNRLNYRYANRRPESYFSGVLENPNLRMFDQSRRIRHDFDWQWQFAIKPQVGLSGTFGYLSDDYDQNFFGLARFSQWHGSADLLYMPKDNVTFYANYSREQYKSFLQTISKTGVPYDLNNRWNREEKDTLDNFGIGVTAFTMREKMLLDLNYVFSNAKTGFVTTNPGTPLANSVLNAQAFPFPDVTTRFQEFNSDISYQFSDNWGIGFRYIFQPYKLDDFAWNTLSPYPINALPTSEQDGRRFLLLDSRYTDHKAHIIGFYVRFGRVTASNY